MVLNLARDGVPDLDETVDAGLDSAGRVLHVTHVQDDVLDQVDALLADDAAAVDLLRAHRLAPRGATVTPMSSPLPPTQCAPGPLTYIIVVSYESWPRSWVSRCSGILSTSTIEGNALIESCIGVLLV